jgi:D-alanine-D-alanine ligase
MRPTVVKKRIGVLMGGLSSEREISLRTGAGVLAALKRRGYEAVPLDWRVEPELDGLLQSSGASLIWNALHGTYGEDGFVQRRLEALGIPYTGSGPEASEAAMDKVRSKKIFEQEGIPTPPWLAAERGGAWERSSALEAAERAGRSFGFPLVVKPAAEGSTVGVTIVRERSGLEAAVEEASRHHGAILFERFITGHEITAAILGVATLGTVEIRAKSGFYDYRAKYLSGDTEYLVPAPLEGDVLDTIHDLSARSHQALGCSGYSRVDLRVTDEGDPFVLEVNTLPGLTETSLFPKVARYAGIDYDDLVERILDTASLKR